MISVPENSTKQQAPGKPFKKGQSGNPGGRPKVSKAFREECQKFMQTEGWGYLFEMARTEGRDQKPAIELVASYAYGKPRQGVDLDMGEGGMVIKVKMVETVEDE